MLTEMKTFRLGESIGHAIMEAELTADQINQLFQDLEQGSAAAGGNRTLIGKGVDAAKAVKSAYDWLKAQAQNSGPVSGFDAAFAKGSQSLGQALGGDQGVMKYVNKYRQFAKEHPTAQKVIYGSLVLAIGISAAMSGSAAAVALKPAIVGILKVTDKLLQGESFSSAAIAGAEIFAAGEIAKAGGAWVKSLLSTGTGGAPTEIGGTGQADATDQAATGQSATAKALQASREANAARAELTDTYAKWMKLPPGQHEVRFVNNIPVEIDGKPVPTNLYTPEEKALVGAGTPSAPTPVTTQPTTQVPAGQAPASTGSKAPDWVKAAADKAGVDPDAAEFGMKHPGVDAKSDVAAAKANLDTPQGVQAATNAPGVKTSVEPDARPNAPTAKGPTPMDQILAKPGVRREITAITKSLSDEVSNQDIKSTVDLNNRIKSLLDKSPIVDDAEQTAASVQIQKDLMQQILKNSDYNDALEGSKKAVINAIKNGTIKSDGQITAMVDRVTTNMNDYYRKNYAIDFKDNTLVKDAIGIQIRNEIKDLGGVKGVFANPDLTIDTSAPEPAAAPTMPRPVPVQQPQPAPAGPTVRPLNAVPQPEPAAPGVRPLSAPNTPVGAIRPVNPYYGTRIRESRQYSEMQVQMVFMLAEAGMWDKAKQVGAAIAGSKAAQVVGQTVAKGIQKAGQVGSNLANKVTADKLQKAWVAAKSPTDSDVIYDIMLKSGVSKAVLDSVFQQMNVEPGDSEEFKTISQQVMKLAPEVQKQIVQFLQKSVGATAMAEEDHHPGKQGYHVKNNSVYGKILAKDGAAVLTDYDEAIKLAYMFNGTLIKPARNRYMIKMSEAPLKIVDETPAVPKGNPMSAQRRIDPKTLNMLAMKRQYDKEVDALKASNPAEKRATVSKTDSVPLFGKWALPVDEVEHWRDTKDIDQAVARAKRIAGKKMPPQMMDEVAGDPEFRKAVEDLYNFAIRVVDSRKLKVELFPYTNFNKTGERISRTIAQRKLAGITARTAADISMDIENILARYRRKYNIDKTGNRLPVRENDSQKPQKAKVDYDPELARMKRFAAAHYPNLSPDAAFQKLMQRSMEHGKKDDDRQDAEIKALATQVANLEQTVSNMSRAQTKPQPRLQPIKR